MFARLTARWCHCPMFLPVFPMQPGSLHCEAMKCSKQMESFLRGVQIGHGGWAAQIWSLRSFPSLGSICDAAQQCLGNSWRCNERFKTGREAHISSTSTRLRCTTYEGGVSRPNCSVYISEKKRCFSFSFFPKQLVVFCHFQQSNSCSDAKCHPQNFLSVSPKVEECHVLASPQYTNMAHVASASEVSKAHSKQKSSCSLLPICLRRLKGKIHVVWPFNIDM